MVLAKSNSRFVTDITSRWLPGGLDQLRSPTPDLQYRITCI